MSLRRPLAARRGGAGLAAAGASRPRLRTAVPAGLETRSLPRKDAGTGIGLGKGRGSS